MDWIDACEALDRLDLAYLLDRQRMSQVLDELTADPHLSLSVEISAKSLSRDPGRHAFAWSELLSRLRTNRDLARRLIIEIRDAAPPATSGTLPLLEELHGLGVGIA